MKTTTVHSCGRDYSVTLVDGGFSVRAGQYHHAIVPNEDAAYTWLGDHGLRRSKIRKLLSQLTSRELL